MVRPRIFNPPPPPQIDPETCIQQPATAVTTKRLGPNAFSLKWEWPAAEVTIYLGSTPQPKATDEALQTVKGETEVQLQLATDHPRPFFHLQIRGGPWHGRCLTTAERFLPLTGGLNFRDIGGYQTNQGQTIRWGQVYRSGHLHELRPADQALLANLPLHTVCDLRTAVEVEKRPDSLPPNPAKLRYVHLPAQNLERSARLRGLWAVLFNRDKLGELMDEGYSHIMIDENPELIGRAFDLLSRPENYPLLFHCTAGKDRTAVIIALLLQLVGVPEETILADYTLSNYHYQKIRTAVAADLEPLLRLGITADHVQAVILVQAARLQKMFDHIRRRYGSTPQYLNDVVGLDPGAVATIKHQLLAPSFTLEA